MSWFVAFYRINILYFVRRKSMSELSHEKTAFLDIENFKLSTDIS